MSIPIIFPIQGWSEIATKGFSLRYLSKQSCSLNHNYLSLLFAYYTFQGWCLSLETETWKLGALLMEVRRKLLCIFLRKKVVYDFFPTVDVQHFETRKQESRFNSLPSLFLRCHQHYTSPDFERNWEHSNRLQSTISRPSRKKTTF
jgi:hypothetical protein